MPVPQTIETHTLTASYYSVKANTDAMLMLSNQGPNLMPVQITLYSLSGEQFNFAPIVFGSGEVRAFNLQDYIPSTNFQEGSLQVMYQGKRLELGGVVNQTNSSQSLIFDEELVETRYFNSKKLEGIWWAKWNDINLKLVLSNNTSSSINATVTIDGTNPNQINPQTFALSPHQTRVLSIDEIVGGEVNNLRKIGGISITHNGIKGGLLARGLIKKASIGYSNVIEFIDPSKPKSTKIDGVGLRIGKINGQKLTQGIVARNIGNGRVKLSGYLSYLKTNNSGEVTIPDVWLEAGETAEIEIDSLVNTEQNFLAAGLHFEHTGQAGKVLISALSVSNDGTQVFRVPFRDAKSASSTGSYPWLIAGNSKAIIYLQNVTNSPQDYKMQIDYEGGNYVLGVKRLAAKQVIAYDLRKLRDEQIPDINGHIIPLNVTGGKAYWSIHGTGKSEIIGRIEQADLISGMSSTSACGRCCPDSYFDSFLSPFTVQGIPGSINQFVAYETDEDCYGSPRLPYPVYSGVYFTSSEISVATVNASSGWAEALDVGMTTIRAEFQGIVMNNCASEAPNEEYCCDAIPVTAICDASCEVLAPTVTITQIKAVGKNQTASIHIDVTNNPNNVAITLNLAPNSGTTGQAKFTSNNSTTRTLTSTEDVEIEGITESSTKDNMRLKATFNNRRLDTEAFTVISVTLTLRTSGSVSNDNAGRTSFFAAFEPNSLGLIHPENSNLGWFTGVEIVGTILPDNFSESVVIKREVLEARRYFNMTLYETVPTGDDTSFPEFRDDNPQSGNSDGKVYDLDGPGTMNNAMNPVGTIGRQRANFKQYATVDNMRVSQDLFWFSRVSVRKTNQNTDVLEQGVANDNQAGVGDTNLTWNLAP